MHLRAGDLRHVDEGDDHAFDPLVAVPIRSQAHEKEDVVIRPRDTHFEGLARLEHAEHPQGEFRQVDLAREICKRPSGVARHDIEDLRDRRREAAELQFPREQIAEMANALRQTEEEIAVRA